MKKKNRYILNIKTTGYFNHLNIDNDVMTWCVNEEILPHVSFLSGHQKKKKRKKKKKRTMNDNEVNIVNMFCCLSFLIK